MDMFESLEAKIKGKKIKIVFPEATDARILGAVVRLKAEDLVEPILVGNVETVKAAAKERGFNIDGISVVEVDDNF